MRCCGILGGMGPEATIDFMRRILSHTRAEGDADHVHCLIDNNPQVPSRVKALLEGGTSPGPVLAEMGRKLEAQGADFLCIPCNTAHNWRKDVASAVKIPVLDMISLAAADVDARVPGCKAAIMCTPGTHKAALYEEPCRKLGLEAIYCDEPEEKRLMGVIDSIKGGDTGNAVRAEFRRLVQHVLDKGARAIIVACTDLSVINDGDMPVPVIDASDSLARAAVLEAAGGEALKD